MSIGIIGGKCNHSHSFKNLISAVIEIYKLLEWLTLINPLFTLLEKKIPGERILNPY